MTDFSEHLARFRASDDAREQFVSKLVRDFEILQKEHRILLDDYSAERDNRRSYQNAVAAHQNEVAESRRQFESSSFVLALIDGDGAIFQDTFLQAATGDGGSEAASRLHNAIRDHVATVYPQSNSNQWPIMVQIYLSLDKLAQKLAHVGLLQSPLELRVFAQRFSMNQPLFSIIDVGPGKEKADHKIKETFRIFSENPTCRHIVFAGCHDSGYVNNFEQIRFDTSKSSQITLLETTPANKVFTGLNDFRRARFEDVFRSEPLPEYVPPTSFQVHSPVQTSVQPFLSRTTTTDRTSPKTTPRQTVSLPSPSVTPAPTESSEESSWAGVSKSGAPTNGNIPIAATANDKKENMNKKWAYYNEAGERLDLPLPSRDPAAAASLEARMKKVGKKMCNHWHIGGRCDNGRNCHFQHEPKLSPAELVALRYKTRSLACKNRWCENVDCYLGHQCALERDVGICSYPESCHLRDRHGMDKRRYVRYDKYNNEELVP